MKFDDKIRAKNGLAVSLRDMGNGYSRIFIDDVLSERNSNPKEWSYESFYTFTPEFENKALKKMEITDKELSKIGVAVVARLLAQNKRVE